MRGPHQESWQFNTRTNSFYPGVFVSSLDNSLVIVTSGTIASEFDSLRNADWLLTSYLVAVSATQPIVRFFTLKTSLGLARLPMRYPVWKTE